MNYDHFTQVSNPSVDCPTVYELYFKTESEVVYTQWDSSISNYIVGFDQFSDKG
jgi:hypothetical protein